LVIVALSSPHDLRYHSLTYARPVEGAHMISGGNATVFVSDLELAVRFYTDTLGLPLKERFENDWAAIDAGNGLIIGLHPPAPFAPKAGVAGGIAIGLDVTDSLETVVDELTRRGVRFDGPIVQDPLSAARLAFFNDPDGNTLYLIEVED
jgi:catechol 2,3-dioxygenase-like lactoylglutathione lyase family enzyme